MTTNRRGSSGCGSGARKRPRGVLAVPKKHALRNVGKDKPPIDIEYRNFVRQSGCALGRFTLAHECFGPCEFAHHPKTKKYGGTGIGLCTKAHTGMQASYHQMGKQSFQKFWGIDLDAEVHTLAHQFIDKYGRVPCV